MCMPLISLQETDEIVLDVTVPSSSLLCTGVPFAGARLVWMLKKTESAAKFVCECFFGMVMVVQSEGSQSEGEEQGGKKGGQKHQAVPSPAESHTAWPQETTQGQAAFNCCCWEQAGAGRIK